MAECWCGDTKKTETKICCVCEHSEVMLMPEYLRKARCPLHHPQKLIMICGECKHVCELCVKLGWISTAGTGGGDYIYNRELGIQIVKGKVVPYNK